MSASSKKVLITAGPTWVSIDGVRVISNIATGKTGILLAEKLCWLGAEVTLVLGPVTDAQPINTRIRFVRFKFFDELKKIIARELSSRKYGAVIHLAAVSDYRPRLQYRKKVESDKRSWKIELIPTEKLIDMVKKIDKSIFLTGFKFEPGMGKGLLIKGARDLMNRANADLIVANTVTAGKYAAWIVTPGAICGPTHSKDNLVSLLAKKIEERLWKD